MRLFISAQGGLNLSLFCKHDYLVLAKLRAFSQNAMQKISIAMEIEAKNTK